MIKLTKMAKRSLCTYAVLIFLMLIVLITTAAVMIISGMLIGYISVNVFNYCPAIYAESPSNYYMLAGLDILPYICLMVFIGWIIYPIHKLKWSDIFEK